MTMLAQASPAVVEFRLEAVQSRAGTWHGELYDAHSCLHTGLLKTEFSTPQAVHDHALGKGIHVIEFTSLPYTNTPARHMHAPTHPITFLEAGKSQVEDHLQSIGVGFATKLQSEREAAAVAKRMERLRFLGAVIATGSVAICVGHLFPLLLAPANLPVLLVSFLASLMGYFLMESASRSLRILQLLSRNKPLQQKFDLLAMQSPAVERFRKERQVQGRPLRTYDVAHANVLRMQEMRSEALDEDTSRTQGIVSEGEPIARIHTSS